MTVKWRDFILKHCVVSLTHYVIHDLWVRRGGEVGRDGEETNMVPYRDKRYHTLSNVTRKAKHFTSSRGK